MKRGFAFFGLTTQLFLLVVLPLTAFLLIIAFGGLSLHQQAMRTLVAERDERAVRAATRTLAEQIDHRTHAVWTLALQVDMDVDPEALSGILETAGSPSPNFEYGVAFLQRGGTVIVSSGAPRFWGAFDPDIDPELEIALERDVPPTHILVRDSETADWILLITAATHKGGPVAVGAASPAVLADQVLSGVIAPTEGSRAMMLSQDGALLYLSTADEPKTPFQIPSVASAALGGDSGAVYSEVDNQEYVIAYSHVQPVGWALIIEEPWEAVASPLLRLTENAPLILVPALLLALVALWFGVRQVVQPLQELESQAVDVGKGIFEAIENPVGGIAEIRRLQRELIRLARRVKASQQGLRGYIGAMTAGQEEERRRLARELHDDTLQSLIALNQRVQLAMLPAAGRVEREPLAEIEILTAQTIDNLRRITRALRPGYLDDLGLETALETLVTETSEGDLEVVFAVEGPTRQLSGPVELAFFRIAQEALSNVVRHSGATNCTVSLKFQADAVTLAIQDNGSGFETPDVPGALTPEGHFGLLGMHERAELIGARLAIRSQADRGTTVVVTLGAGS